MNIGVGLGDYRVGVAAPDEWVIYGLGSCIGLILCDPSTKISALAHVVLPESPSLRPVDQPAKYADTVVPFLVEEMRKLGAWKHQIHAQLTGGARVLNISDFGDIGMRNAKTIIQALFMEKIPLVAERVGGTRGRTLRWDPWRGRAVITSVGMPEETITPPNYVFKEVGVNGVGVGGR